MLFLLAIEGVSQKTASYDRVKREASRFASSLPTLQPALPLETAISSGSEKLGDFDFFVEQMQ